MRKFINVWILFDSISKHGSSHSGKRFIVLQNTEDLTNKILLLGYTQAHLNLLSRVYELDQSLNHKAISGGMWTWDVDEFQLHDKSYSFGKTEHDHLKDMGLDITVRRNHPRKEIFHIHMGKDVKDILIKSSPDQELWTKLLENNNISERKYSH